MADSKLSRRQFISGVAVTGLNANLARAATEDRSAKTENLRVVFATDTHLMVDNALRSEEGLTACLEAIEQLQPKPQLIICGGDLTHESPLLDCNAADALFERFNKVWRGTTKIQSYFTFGNHDLVGTQNSGVKRDDPRFGKGLFQMRLELSKTYYIIRQQAWRFIILDDVRPVEDGTYAGEFFAEQLAFLRAELTADKETPTVICGHIPSASTLPAFHVSGLTSEEKNMIKMPASLTVFNAPDLTQILSDTKANVKLVLAGHLHHLEQIRLDEVCFFNAGAVCGNWWKGKQRGCPEGFTILDLDAAGAFQANYQAFGWAG